MKLARRLLLGSTLVVGVLVVVVVALSDARLGAEVHTLVVGELTREARFIAAEWTPTVDPDSLATNAGAALGHRVTLIDSTGRVIGDSRFHGAARERLENHSHRPEVMQAKQTGVGSSERVSPSAGDRELYVAVTAPLGTARVSIATRVFDAIVARARRDVLLSGLAALVVALLLAYAFSRDVTRPIIELRDVARDLAHGDLSRRPSLSAPGEVGELGDAIRNMADQLASRLQALQSDEALMSALVEALSEGVVAVDASRRVVRLNQSARRFLELRAPVPFSVDLLPRDPILREALVDAMEHGAAEQLEITLAGHSLLLTTRPFGGGGAVLALFDLTASRRLDAVRRDFVANVSHELKTPLTVINGYAETLAADDLTPAQRATFTTAIFTNAQRMLRIVDDLLDLSRIESGGWVPNPARIDVETAAAEVTTPIRNAAESKGVIIDIAVDPCAAVVHADPTAVRQILANLTGNAVRYTPSGGTVTVFTEPDAHGVWLGVRDTGVGIAPQHLPRIFERFYRADPGRSREAGGTGLGLAIVKHLAEAHGGRVRAESTVGLGTTIAVLLPSPDVPET
ncbi:MAG TPA: ATP-binding protein [Gemmatimonadaceae bacterium]|nr:ATP-binding protein [Gemmatimonadaceae bacterium]